MLLDLEPLKQATERLEEAIVRLRGGPEDAMVRDSVVKRFEFTYELSYRMLRRFLSLTEPNPEIPQGDRGGARGGAEACRPRGIFFVTASVLSQNFRTQASLATLGASL